MRPGGGAAFAAPPGVAAAPLTAEELAARDRNNYIMGGAMLALSGYGYYVVTSQREKALKPPTKEHLVNWSGTHEVEVSGSGPAGGSHGVLLPPLKQGRGLQPHVPVLLHVSWCRGLLRQPALRSGMAHRPAGVLPCCLPRWSASTSRRRCRSWRPRWRRRTRQVSDAACAASAARLLGQFAAARPAAGAESLAAGMLQVQLQTGGVAW